MFDYLVKPITFDRFFKAASKANDYHQLVARATQHIAPAGTGPSENYFFIKCDYKYEKIFFDDILYVQGLQNYVTIYTGGGKYITLLNLKKVEENLNGESFIRVHKSYVVSVQNIEAIENNEILSSRTGSP